MTKASDRKPKSTNTLAGKVLGETRDGVRILKPKGKATHFTQKEIRAAIATVRANKSVR